MKTTPHWHWCPRCRAYWEHFTQRCKRISAEFGTTRLQCPWCRRQEA